MPEIPAWTLSDFMDDACDCKAVSLVKKVEEGVVVRLCIALLDDRNFDLDKASIIDVQVPWQAFEDSKEGTLKEIGAYAPFAEVSDFDHDGPEEEEPVESKEGWCEVCGGLTSNETLFELAVTFSLAADDSGQLREWMKAHQVKRALLPVGASQDEELEPLL